MMKTVFCIICFLGSLCIGLSQNPFDIKAAPGKKQEPKVINNAPPPSKPEPKSVEPPKPTTVAPTGESKQIPAKVPANQTPVTSNTTIQTQNPNATNSGSKNIFDIKAGKENNTVIINNNSSATSTQNNSTIPPETVPAITNSATQQSNQTSTIPTNGLEGVQNPFNIKAGNDPNQQPTSIVTPELSTPKLEDIKEQIEEFKTNTAGTKGSISKNQWFIIYIFLFLLAGIAINFNRSYPLALIKATYNQNQMRILFKDAFKGNHSFIFGILYFIFIINAGIFLYLSFQIFNIAPLSLLAAISIVLAVYLVRHLVLFVMGIIFPMTKETTLFSYTIGIYNLTLGIALLFLNVVLSFVDIETAQMLIFSGLTIILVLYVMRQIRGLLSNVPAIAASKFHFIIYLCTVEIAPWLLLSGILLR